MKDSGLREPGVGDLRDPFPRHTVLLATALIPNRVSLPRYGCRVGLRIVLFEACSAFTRVTACTLALSPYLVTRLSEGFSHFVSSIAAPVASGWSRCRVGLAPTGKRRLCTAHARSGYSIVRPFAVAIAMMPQSNCPRGHLSAPLRILRL